MKESTARKYFIFWSLVLLTSVIYSKFILSVSIIGLCLTAVVYKKNSFSFRLPLSFALVTLFFLGVMVSGINSENLSGWAHHLRMKLPFLLLPLAIYNLPQIKQKEYMLVHYFFVVLVTLSAIPTVIDYVFNFEEWQIALGQGQSLTTPVNHVKFSAFLAFSILSLVVLYSKKFTFKKEWERHFQLGLIIASIITIHLLAVRTGIVILYVSSFLLLAFHAIRTKNWKNLLAIFALAFIMPWVAYKTVPSLNKKVEYMFYDINQYLAGSGDNYSDSDRLISLKIGNDIWKKNRMIGTGIGDLKQACSTLYLERYGPEKYVLYPHNQYLFILAGSGLVGLFLFLFAFLGPVYRFRFSPDNTLFIILVLIMGLLFFIDNGIERSFSIAFYAYFLCIGIGYLRKLKKDDG